MSQSARALRKCGKIGAAKHARHNRPNPARCCQPLNPKNIRDGSAITADMSKKRTPCCREPNVATSVSRKNQLANMQRIAILLAASLLEMTGLAAYLEVE